MVWCTVRPCLGLSPVEVCKKCGSEVRLAQTGGVWVVVWGGLVPVDYKGGRYGLRRFSENEGAMEDRED